VIRPTARPRRWSLAAAVFCAAIGFSSPAASQPLPVPFLPQTEDLCGGAAAAMVMRYWGAADVYPDVFAPLVDRAAGGITTGRLVADLRQRGWIAFDGSGDAGEMTKELSRGRPLIALIEDRPGRFHYVVVVERGAGRVVVHDPARAPSREVDAARFDAAWQQAGRWMLILLPPPVPGLESGRSDMPGTKGVPESRPGAEEAPESRPGTGARCEAVVELGVQLAADDRAAARTTLKQATAACPDGAAAWRELAGLDALDGDWTSAAANARRAVTLQPDDQYAWRILATADYVRHDDLAALAAWNRIGQPVVNLIDVKGLVHTRYDVIADAIGVELKSVLTPDALTRGERRVRDLPAVAGARLSFHPVEGERAQLDAAIVERDRVPAGYPALIRIGFGAATGRELSSTISNVSGGGDAAGVTWRWWRNRPLLSAFYAAPAPRAIGGGVWQLEAARETQTFGTAAFEETRTRVAMTLGNWLTSRTRVSAAAGFERWRDRANDVSFSAGIEHWRLSNRLRLAADVTQAAGVQPFSFGQASVGARTKSTPQGFVLTGIAGYSLASDASPASVWPGADTGHARDVLLRAHPLLADGIIVGPVFGRRLTFGTVEAQRWLTMRRLPVRWAPALFADTARAWRGIATTGERLQIDAGGGIRVAVPGAGVMRIDVARGLRGGGVVVSAGWDRRWR